MLSDPNLAVLPLPTANFVYPPPPAPRPRASAPRGVWEPTPVAPCPISCLPPSPALLWPPQQDKLHAEVLSFFFFFLAHPHPPNILTGKLGFFLE